MLIIDDLLIGLPAKSLIFIMQKIRDVVDEELNKEQKRKLLSLDEDLMKEVISSREYLEKELEIVSEARKKEKK